VQVSWEPLPSVTATDKATGSGAAKVHDGAPGNVAFKWALGDARHDQPFKSAGDVGEEAHREPASRRQRDGAARVRGRYEDATGELTLWVTSQNPHVHRLPDVRLRPRIPENKVRVIAPDVGGGFGSKIFLYNEEVVCSWASRQLKRPIRWTAAAARRT
jgi:carbon-monoxide dehydrogenase large subunit